MFVSLYLTKCQYCQVVDLIPISLQPDCVNLQYFKLKLFDLTEFIV